ncbi:uncharacterized protein LOC123440457 [Hordeum vulgare subsp. vulgare]|uniref:Uncharacterized protein n=1 Tax=Hordeum vulgare subsp. vulgare TaxID=112509 RepID=A0A8I6X970_HORVV|nr:uncharacterized protein LOC123440457 [Hordeum vulgare subsp. vulgare]
MAGQRNRNRIRRQRAKARLVSEVEAEAEAEGAARVPEVDGEVVTAADRVVQRKIPLSKLSQSATKEELRRRSLIGQIRGHYLDAISRLPTTELATTLARGLLIAGHCYGPLHPVHNIIVNSVWHSAAFPMRASDRIDAPVISCRTISRLVQRSLDGLVASLRHLCPGLSDDDALWHLSLSRADLRAAVASARGFRLTASELEAAFEAAAKAAGHVKPVALALFASSVLLSVERDVVSLLNNKRRLSSADILCLSTTLLPSPLPDELPDPPLEERFTAAFKLIARKRSHLTRWYTEWVEIADTALRKYARQTAEHYLLHIIYGYGALRDEFHMVRSYHINFMAWPKNPCAREAPVFFFAKALLPSVSGFCEEDITLCCTVQPSPVEVDRCHTCLAENFQIDHPDDSKNFGGGQYYHMDGIGEDLDCPIMTDVDYRCFDPVRDIGFVECLNQDFVNYMSSSPWHRRYKKQIDLAISDYCTGII